MFSVSVKTEPGSVGFQIHPVTQSSWDPQEVGSQDEAAGLGEYQGRQSQTSSLEPDLLTLHSGVSFISTDRVNNKTSTKQAERKSKKKNHRKDF